MTKINSWMVEGSRKLRDRKLKRVAEFLVKIKVSANLLTFLSLLNGIAAAYFLFNDAWGVWFFALFLFLHLLFDALDGVVARLAGPTKLGKWLDFIVDNFVVVPSLLLAVYLFLGDYAVLVALGLSLLTHLLYAMSSFHLPIMHVRTWLACILIFDIWVKSEVVATVAFLTIGVLSLFSLSQQAASYHLLFRKPKK